MIKRKKYRSRLFPSLILILSFLFTACSAASHPSEENSKYDAASQPADVAMQDISASQAAKTPPSEQKTEANAPSAPQAGVLPSPAVPLRKMIYKADLTAEVENFLKARSTLTSLITKSQGYVLSSSEYESEKEKGANIVIRIPQAGFSALMDDIDKLATKVPIRSIQGQDVTEEYVDLTSRLKARQVVEARLLDFMANAKKTEDLLKISNDLGTVQGEIEQIKGRMRYLDENVAYSTISLTLIEKKVTAKLVDVADASTWEKAWLSFHGSLLAILSFLHGFFIFIAGAIPVLVFLAIPGIPAFFYFKRHRKKKQAPSPTSID